MILPDPPTEPYVAGLLAIRQGFLPSWRSSVDLLTSASGSQASALYPSVSPISGHSVHKYRLLTYGCEPPAGNPEPRQRYP
jgi:hypothetical protein